MDTEQQIPETPGLLQRNRNLIKGFMISFLILALLIPTFFITQLIRERQQRNEEVKREIASQWSVAQTITGPVLAIPYLQSEKSSDNKYITVKHLAYFLPEDLKITGDLAHDFRARSSIFKLIVYTANLQISGSFKPLQLAKLNLSPKDSLGQYVL
jgi:inner membrane protein